MMKERKSKRDRHVMACKQMAQHIDTYILNPFSCTHTHALKQIYCHAAQKKQNKKKHKKLHERNEKCESITPLCSEEDNFGI